MAVNKLRKRKNKAGLDRTGASDDGGSRPVTLGQFNESVDKVNEVVDIVNGTVALPGDLTVTGNLTVNGNTVLANAITDTVAIAGTLSGTLTFEGTTPDAFEIVLDPGEPSGSDKTITLPNITGTVILDAGTQTVGGAKTFSSQVLGPGGSAAIPSFAAGLTNMGIYQSSATELGFAASGTFVARMSTVEGIAATAINTTPIGTVTPAAGTFTSATATTSVVTDTISERTGASGVTVDNLQIKDGVPGKLDERVATADGLTTGLLTGANQFVSVSSANADFIISLPLSTSVPVGTKIRGWVASNGFELRVDASEAATATINNVTTNVEAAIPATTLFIVEKVASLKWILTAIDELGADIAAIVPDAV